MQYNNKITDKEMEKKRFALTIVILLFITSSILAQDSQLYMPINIKKAYENKTRSLDGTPGTAYWQNRADYKIDVHFDPSSRLVSGKEKIVYFNNSPDTLRQLVFHLFPDIYKKGNAHDPQIVPSDQGDGTILEKLSLNRDGENLLAKDGAVTFEHTGFVLNLPAALAPRDQTQIDLTWHYTLNRKTHIREGAVDSSAFFVAYFFPRLAVYDDIDGWNRFKYTGTAEFYNDFGDFEVAVTVPQDYLVWATGVLQNPQEVLAKKYLQRYQSAFTCDEIIHIVDSTEAKQKGVTKSGKNIWKFKAENVSDFAFATSNHYLWDASSLMVDKKTGRRVLVDAAYNKNSKDFYEVVEIAKKSIDFMSTQMPGVPYPYPKETVFNAVAEMEYPMMVNNPSYSSRHSTIRITAHEIFHSYFPFYTGCNESRYAWMDEGLTTFGTYLMSEKLDGPGQGYLSFFSGYKEQIGHFSDLPIFVDSNVLKRPVYNHNSYVKPASFFLILQDELDQALFSKVLIEFVNRWQGRHPTPYDFFFTFAAVSQKNLDWLIKPWFFEYGYVDLAVQNVQQKGKHYKITIAKKGHYPANFALKIIFDDGSFETESYKASVWEKGNTIVEINKFADKKIKTLEIIDKSIIDADLSNNIFNSKPD